MFIKKYMKKEKGLTLIEVLITIAILGIVIIPLSSMFIASTKINNDSNDRFKTTLLAQQYMEDIKLSDSIIEGETKYNVDDYTVIVNITKVLDFSQGDENNFYNEIDYDFKIKIDKENKIILYDDKDNLLQSYEIIINPSIELEMTNSNIIVKFYDNNNQFATETLKGFGNKANLVFELLGDSNVEIKAKNLSKKDLILYFCKNINSTGDYSFTNLGGEIVRFDKILIPNNENQNNLKGLYKIDIEVKKDGYTLQKITGYK